MNLDELFEKCRLTAGEVRHYLVTGCGLDGSANCWYSVDIDDWLVIARAQLRKAIPVVQKMERERIRQMLHIPSSDEPYCLDCACLPDVDNCRLYGITLKWDENRQGHLRCEQCRKEW